MKNRNTYNLGFKSVHTGKILWACDLSGDMVQWDAITARKECTLQRRIFKDRNLINTQVITRKVLL